MGNVILKDNGYEVNLDSADLNQARASAHVSFDYFYKQVFSDNKVFPVLTNKFATVTDKLMRVAGNSLEDKDRQILVAANKAFAGMSDVLFIMEVSFGIRVSSLTLDFEMQFLCKTKEFEEEERKSLAKELQRLIPARLQEKWVDITKHITEGLVDIPSILESVYKNIEQYLKQLERILEFEVLCRCDKDSDLFKTQ